MAVHFFTQGYNFNLPQKRLLKKWIQHVIEYHKFEVGDINYIFTDVDQILEINNQYLNHNYPTDIITFPLSELPIISADIYICIPVVKENAQQYNQSFVNELHRVLIHGILHLIGYNDSSDEEQKIMRQQEDYWINSLVVTLNA